MIQLEGPITIGGQDYSAEITRCTIKWQRNTTTRPATFGNAQETEGAGATKLSCEIEFLNDVAATSVWAELLSILETDTAETEIVAQLKTGAVGPDNPSFTFTAVVIGTEAGGTPGEQNRHAYTFPIVSGIVVDVAP
jgi:hypothetical protein